jgi:hypothetical protein
VRRWSDDLADENALQASDGCLYGVLTHIAWWRLIIVG